MKKAISKFFLLIILTLLYGCPYDSKFSIDQKPIIQIDTLLIGDWFGYNIKRENENLEFKVYPFNDTEYLIEITTTYDTDTLKEICRGFISELKTDKIINLQGIDFSTNNNYAFYKYEFENGDLYISWINDSLLGKQIVSSSEELRDLFEKNHSEKEFYEYKYRFKLKKK